MLALRSLLPIMVVLVGLGPISNHVEALALSRKVASWPQFWFPSLMLGAKLQSCPDVHIAGCGRLGQYLCDRLVRDAEKEGSRLSIVAETRSGVLKPISCLSSKASASVRVARRGDRRLSAGNSGTDSDMPFCRSMVIAFPPYARGTNGDDGSEYLAEVEACVAAWKHNRLATEGKLILVSSTGVYADNDDEVLTEATAVTPKSAYVARLKAAEDYVLAAGGYVLRLGGLYDADSGPHLVYLSRLAAAVATPAPSAHTAATPAIPTSSGRRAVGEAPVPRAAGVLRNRVLRMMSYADAADLLCAMLGLPVEGEAGDCSCASGRVFLGLGGSPTSSRAILEDAAFSDWGRQRLREMLSSSAGAAGGANVVSAAALKAAVDRVFASRSPERRGRFDDSATRTALGRPHSRSRWPYEQQHETMAGYFKWLCGGRKD